MTKEKIQSLNKYLQGLKDRLSGPVPDKHKNGPETFKAWLNHEIHMVTDKLERAKLEGVVEAPKK